MSVDALTQEVALRPQRFTLGVRHLRSALAAQEEVCFAWIPVALTIGIWSYFAWSHEPSSTLVAILMGVACLLAVFWARTRNPLLLGICLVLAGFGLAKFRTEWVRAPVLPATTGEISCEGTVTGVEARRGSRVSLTISVSSLSGIASSNTPAAIKLLASDTPKVAIGDQIRAHCRLFPPPAPVSPGGFDYARTLWFEGIGATGRVIGPVAIVSRQASLTDMFQAWLQDLRTMIGERIRSQLTGDIGAIGEALITGERAEISREANTNLQISGLAHVLSISGLHMSLVAGGVFALVRALLALSPSLALRRPIKKWAACAALFAGFAYLLLSGSAVATQRSYIMLAIMFLAILIDRPALSTRNLALAALFILIVEPEAAISASFQMSFLAVVGLVSFYDSWSSREREEREVSTSQSIVVLQRAIRVVLLAAATTLIAGTLS
ncbi:MAG: ComEC family competence protein, partial [Rhizobiales bacterium]|nr:ComEC family competence protein [Hyphomicrobiales bacterium]